MSEPVKQPTHKIYTSVAGMDKTTIISVEGMSVEDAEKLYTFAKEEMET